MEPPPNIDEAAEVAGASRIASRWRGYLFLRQAAEHYVKLCAMHGHRPDVTAFPAHLVLSEIKCSTELDRLSYWMQKHMSKKGRKG